MLSEVRREDTQLATRTHPGLLHTAIVVDDDEAFVSHVAPFLRDGFDEGATLAVLNRRHWALLREELGADAARVSFTDCNDFYIRPIDALASYDAPLRRLTAEGSTSVRVAAEIPLGATRSGWDDWMSYEAIVNHAFAHRPANILCAYDTNTAPDAVIDAVWRTHPHVVTDGDASGPHYHDPADMITMFGRAPRRDLLLRSLPSTRDATEFRGVLSAELAGARAPRTKILNMLVAASEAFDNAVMHGDGPTALRAGLVDGWFVCEIEDQGPGLDDPLAGYVPPEPGEPGRRGLWVARQLVSRLELIPAEPGLIVRLWL
jgi:anti-sigma regulatory factor (Ser/Thr protein kinase)